MDAQRADGSLSGTAVRPNAAESLRSRTTRGTDVLLTIMLLLKKQFFPAVRSGAKTTTLRYWHRRQARPGSVHLVPGLGRVRIESVEPANSRTLTEDDARADGFDSLKALREALDHLYPRSRRKLRTLYRVRFTLLDPA